MKYSLYILAYLFISSTSVFGGWQQESSAPIQLVNTNLELEVDETGKSTEVLETEKKALNDQGRSQLVMQTVPFLPDAEIVKVIKASSITDGIETPVDLKTITERTAKGPDQGINHHREYVIPFTNIKVGSSIKYTVRRQQTKTLVDGLFNMSFIFGLGVPEQSGFARITSKLPIHIHRSDPWRAVSVNPMPVSGKYVIEIKQTKPVFKTPDELLPILNSSTYSSIYLSTMTQWKEYTTPLASKYESLLKQNKLPKTFDAIVKRAQKFKTAEEKIDFVTSELDNVMTYSGDWSSFEKGFIPKNLDEIANKKIGDCKDFSIATVAMLRKLGLQANVAFTYRSTPGAPIYDRSNIKLVMDFFNHAIVKVHHKGKVLWVDPTNVVSDAGYIFYDIAGSPAIEISKDSNQLEYIPYPESSQSRVVFEKTLKIGGDNKGESITNFEMTGDFSKFIHEIALTKSEQEAHKLLMMYLKTDSASAKSFYEGINIKSRISKKLKGVQKSFGENVYSTDKDKTYISVPMTYSLVGVLPIRDNRQTDLNLMARFSEKTVTKIEGFDFVGFPLNCYVMTPWFDVRRNLYKTEKGFEVHDDIEFKKPIVRAFDVNSDNFQMHRSDLLSCFTGKDIEVRALNKGETLASRLTDYNKNKIDELLRVNGPASVSTAEEAFHIASQLVFMNSNSKDGLIGQARALSSVGYKHSNVERNEYEALQDITIKKLEKIDPQNPVALRLRAGIFLDKNDINQALIYFSKAFAADPKNSWTYRLGGRILERQKQYDKAAGSYRKAIELTKELSEKSSIAARIGHMYGDIGDSENAIKAYRECVTYDPKNTWVQGTMITMLTQLERYDEAISQGEAMLKIADYGLGRRFVAMAYAHKADKLYYGALKKDPSLKSTEVRNEMTEVEKLYLSALKHVSNYGPIVFRAGRFYRELAVADNNIDYARKSLGFLEMSEELNERGNRGEMEADWMGKVTKYKEDMKMMIQKNGSSSRIPANK